MVARSGLPSRLVRMAATKVYANPIPMHGCPNARQILDPK